MTTNRVDSYREVHKGLRFELCNWVRILGRLDAEDPALIAELRAKFAQFQHLLESHSKLEEQWLHPLLKTCAPALYTDLEADHGVHEARFQGVVQAFDALAEGGDDVWPMAETLYRRFAEFVGHYLVHLAREEDEANSALQANHSAPELLGISAQLRASIPPETMGQYLSIMFPGMNVVERATMLGGIKAHAPSEVFDGICALAKNVLDTEEWSAVSARINV